MVLCVELGEGDGSVGDVLSELVEGGFSVCVVEGLVGVGGEGRGDGRRERHAVDVEEVEDR